MRPLYSIAVWAYSFAIAIASIWNTKARLIRRGRKHTWKRLASLDAAKQTVWFHCASLGEFEMARPVMEGFLDQNPSFQLVVSFFSPSGFEFRKNYERAAAVVYLPADVAKNTQKFVDLVKPAFAVFVKYDLWYHYLRILKERQIPYYLISAVFRPGHRYFKNKLFYSMLSDAQQIFVQDDVSLELLQQNGLAGTRAGDTRCDRVLQIAASAKVDERVSEFCGNNRILIAGSCWPAEEKLLAEAYKEAPEGWRFILAPHDISESHLQNIEKRWVGKTVRFSHLKQASDKGILIIDNIGMLAGLYKIAHLAFVGGGFSGYLHNILEPAAHGCAVVFGPKHNRYHEAAAMVRFGAAKNIGAAIAFQQVLRNTEWQLEAGVQAQDYVLKHAGATKLILESLK